MWAVSPKHHQPLFSCCRSISCKLCHLLPPPQYREINLAACFGMELIQFVCDISEIDFLPTEMVCTSRARFKEDQWAPLVHSQSLWIRNSLDWNNKHRKCNSWCCQVQMERRIGVWFCGAEMFWLLLALLLLCTAQHKTSKKRSVGSHQNPKQPFIGKW